METLEPILAKHEFLKDLDPRYLQSLTGCALNARFEAGQYIYHEGEKAIRFFLIRKGKVAIEIHAPGRGSIVIQTIGEGDLLGWSSLVPPYEWRFSARAVEPTMAIALNGECIRGKFDKDHDLGYELLKRFSTVIVQRLRATRLQLLDVYGAAPKG